MLYYLKYKYLGVKNFFKNIWNFRSFLVRDRWFDHYYLLQMLNDKLKYDVKMYKCKSVTSHPEHIIEKMELVTHLLDRVAVDGYYENSFKCYGNVLYDKNTVFSHKKETKLYQHGDLMVQNDIDYLFKIISKNILYWWD